jgi:CBS domain containing-hemolysin-like protein
VTNYIFSIILLIIALIAIELRKIYHALPKNEIRFRARQGDALAKKIYHAISYQESLEIFLWTVILLSVSGSLLLLNSVAPSWLNFIAVAIYLGLAFAWLPRVRYNSLSDKLAASLSPAIVWILNYLHPSLQKAYNILSRNKPKNVHTGIYDHQDLYDLLDKQKSQSDSRISPSELELVTKTLGLSKKIISQYQKTWPNVICVAENDSIGPVLLDELHKSNQYYAPVIDQQNEVVGILDVRRLDMSTSGKAVDHMDANIHYLLEDESLKSALKIMTKTSSPAYIVKDTNDNNVGIITLSDVLSELIVEEAEIEEELSGDEDDDLTEQINDQPENQEASAQEGEAV